MRRQEPRPWTDGHDLDVPQSRPCPWSWPLRSDKGLSATCGRVLDARGHHLRAGLLEARSAIRQEAGERCTQGEFRVLASLRVVFVSVRLKRGFEDQTIAIARACLTPVARKLGFVEAKLVNASRPNGIIVSMTP